MTAGSVLTVRVAGEMLSLPTGDVAEIVRPRAWTRVPNGPPSLLGLANLRGTVLPVVSLAALLGHAEAAPSRMQRVVVAGPGEPVGYLVDEVLAFARDSGAAPLDLGALLARDFTVVPAKPARQVLAAVAAAASEHEEESVALLVLHAAGQEYAIGLDQVSAILQLPAGIAGVGQDAVVVGVMPWKGGILPLVSLAALLGRPLEPGAMLRVAAVALGDGHVGLVATGLDTILRVPKRTIGPVPAVLSRGKGEARLDGICHLEGGRRLVSLLAPERLFDDATTRRILAQTQHEQAAQGGVGMPDQTSSGKGMLQFVVFALAGERYGLPIAAVDEVVRRPASLTRVPRAPAFIEGVMNLRGRVVPVINQASRFAAASTGQGGRVIIVTVGGLQAGFAVDAVTGILTVDAGALRSAPGLAAGQTDIFDRVALNDEGAMTLLIDPASLLDQAERELLATIAADKQTA